METRWHGLSPFLKHRFQIRTTNSRLSFDLQIKFLGKLEWGCSLVRLCQERKGIFSPQSSFCITKRQEARAEIRLSLQRWGTPLPQQYQDRPQIPPAEDFSRDHLRGARRESEASLWRLKDSEDPEDRAKSGSWTPNLVKIGQRNPLYSLLRNTNLRCRLQHSFLSLSTQFLLCYIILLLDNSFLNHLRVSFANHDSLFLSLCLFFKNKDILT